MLEQEILKEWGMDYEQLVAYLQNKYGLPKKNYFCKGMNHANPAITMTWKGLYIHHVAEDRAINLSTSTQAKQYPAEYQEPQMLTYCNLLEHLILHIKIVEKTRGDFGSVGLGMYIIPTLNDFYFYGKSFLQFWEIACYEVVQENYNDYLFLLKEYVKIRVKVDNASLFRLRDQLSFSNRELSKIRELYKKWDFEFFYQSADGTQYEDNCKTLMEWENRNDTEIVIPDETVYIKNRFSACQNLRKVFLPNSVKDMDDETFCDCIHLTEIKLSDSLKDIRNGVFKNCSNLKEINIPNSVKCVSMNAFSACRSLIKIIIPDSVTFVGLNAFSACSALRSVTIGKSVKIISNAFAECFSLTNILYTGTASEWTQIEGLQNIMSSNRILHINNEPLTTVVLENITKIQPFAFCNCTSLSSITIPDSVTSIGENAFENCPCVKNSRGASYVDKWLLKCYTKSTSIAIKVNTVGIAEHAFCDCSKLTTMIIPDSVKYIGQYAFSNCTYLDSITISNSVTRIENHAFENCNSLTSFIVPNSIAFIGYEAFHNCSSLVNITYNGTKAQWKNISKEGWKHGSVIKQVICTDGTINL